MFSVRPILAVAILSLCVGFSAAQDSSEEFFEKSIRPLLAEHCWQCHGPEKQWNGLRLDSAEAIQRGGDSGPALVANKADASLLLQAVLRSGDLQMPPDDPLKPEQIALLRQWIEMGAPWPKSSKSSSSEAWKTHWAFQPIQKVSPPEIKSVSSGNEGSESTSKVVNPIDQFVLQRLSDHGMQPSPQADRATLIRRATYTVTGLPPTFEQIQAFVNDPRPDAYERLIDELLESPRYGEHLGRMWLDVARYSDTKGYVYAREERFFVNAALYRDWVIAALNSDMPYDRFLKLQIAADQVAPEDPKSLAAMGLLTLGRRFLGVTHDIIDDRIDVVGRGTMGLTISCARCHDHKYDPIPTADYYSLYGVFQCSTDRQVDLSAFSEAKPSAEFTAELEKRQKTLQETTATRRLDAANRVRARVADYLFAQTELSKYGEEGFDVVLATTDIIPAFVRRWEGFLSRKDSTNDPVFAAWLQMAAIDSKEFAEKSDAVWQHCRSIPTNHPLVAELLDTKPESMRQLADRYGQVFSQVDTRHKELSAIAKESMTAEQKDWLASVTPWIEVMYGATAPCEVPDEEVISTETFFDSGTCNELWKLQGEVDRWRLQAAEAPQVAVAVFDRATLVDPRVFRRGNPANKGQRVSRHFVSLLSKFDPQTFTTGSGRRELAERIVDTNNPLTPRVWVNRLWQHHFGQALVQTPSDFGLRAQPPSHPELLDWLADQLIQSGWSSKSLQRMMLLSATYRQVSFSSSDVHAKNQQIDPENRLLWRMNNRRLHFEELRDSLLMTSDDLQQQLGGKAKEMFGKDDTNRRRTIYGLIDRQFLPATLRVFDFANPDLHIGRRSETQVPQQSLYFMNHPFIAARAKSLIGKVSTTTNPSTLISRVYRNVLKRDPVESEVKDALAFLSQPQATAQDQPTQESLAWSYGFGEVDQAENKLKSFNPLPYFAGGSLQNGKNQGGAWQGGANFPDGKLGWVQLTASGGHPGNDLAHACVRRWTAPGAMSVSIASTARHELDISDGVRCRIFSSRHGLLAEATVKASQAELSVPNVDVQAGDTIDFVVDILKELSHDQHLWSPVIQQISAADVAETKNAAKIVASKWDASRDFYGPATAQLSTLEQLAQVLMLTNEFSFVD